jgi:hypothetical protein
VVEFLRQIEGFLERAVEGSSRALFRQRLQPIELAKAAARAMQRQRLVGPEGVEVPNQFVIALHPDDLAVHAPYRASLEARITRYLATFAEERGFVPVGDIATSLLEDPGVRRWSVRVDAQMADAQMGPMTRPVGPIEATAHLPRVERRPPPQHGSPSHSILVLEDGRWLPVGHGSLRIGRALDNDLVIGDSRVSRYHARLDQDQHGLVVHDLGSTNGTVVVGQPVGEGRLMPGDVLSLGGYRVEVRQGDPRASAAPDGRG